VPCSVRLNFDACRSFSAPLAACLGERVCRGHPDAGDPDPPGSVPTLIWGCNTVLDPHPPALGFGDLASAPPQTFHGAPRFVIWPSLASPPSACHPIRVKVCSLSDPSSCPSPASGAGPGRAGPGHARIPISVGWRRPVTNAQPPCLIVSGFMRAARCRRSSMQFAPPDNSQAFRIDHRARTPSRPHARRNGQLPARPHKVRNPQAQPPRWARVQGYRGGWGNGELDCDWGVWDELGECQVSVGLGLIIPGMKVFENRGEGLTHFGG
jgi:hypothetical protein